MQALENTTRQLNDEKAALLDYVQEKDQANDDKASDLDKIIATQEEQIRRLKNNINVMHEQLNKQAIEGQQISDYKAAGSQQHYMSNQSAGNQAQVLSNRNRSHSNGRSNEKVSVALTNQFDGMNREELIERIELLEAQLEKARILSDEQNQQLQWLSDYYKEEIDQLKSKH